MGSVTCATLRWAFCAYAAVSGSSRETPKMMSNDVKILLELPIDPGKDAIWVPSCHWSVADRYWSLARSDGDDELIGDSPRMVTRRRHLPYGSIGRSST